MNNDFLVLPRREHAEAYIEEFNLSIVPLRPNHKTPITKRGHLDATNDINKLRDMYIYPHCNIATSLSTHYMLVLDCDVDLSKGYDGVSKLKELEEELGALPEDTVTVITPRGGKHYYFSCDEEDEFIGKLSPDIDVKHKGYTLLPPSCVNSRNYVFEEGKSFWETSVKPIPAAWKERLIKPVSEVNMKVTPKSFPLKTWDEFQVMLDNCSFLQHCVGDPEQVSYQEWLSFASILSQVKDGEYLFHYYSYPHSQYNSEQAQKLFNRCVAFGKPHTCPYISGISDACAECSNKRKQV